MAGALMLKRLRDECGVADQFEPTLSLPSERSPKYEVVTTFAGWAPQVAFADGLRATVDWYRGNRWWWEPIKHNDPAFRSYYKAQYETRSGA